MHFDAPTDLGESVSAKPLAYSEFAVDSSIAAHVACGWSFEASETLAGPYQHHVLPDGCISLLYRCPRRGGPRWLVLSGPRIDELRVEVQAGDRYWGIRFWPDAGGALLGLDPSALRGRADLLTMRAPALAQQLVGPLAASQTLPEAQEVFRAFVQSRLSDCPPNDPAIRQAVAEIHRASGAVEIREIAEAVGLSLRQLQRRFRARVGLTPKEFARIRRVRVALANALQPQPSGWAAVAAHAGFADQAHFSRDAAALTGLTPAGFEQRIEPIDHRNVDP